MDRNNVKFCVIACLVLIATFVSIGTASIVEPHYVNPCGFCESTPDAVVTTSTCDLSIAYNEIVNENGVVNPLWKSVVQLNNSSDSVSAISNSEKQLESPTEEYWAVIVGGSSFCAHQNAEDMYNVLTMASENWDARHIRLLVNESATKANIRDAIRWMANNANTEDTCIFYFSGHGEQSIDDNGDELDGLDESLLTYYNETILDDELEEWIGDVKAEKVVAILEACYCGGVLTIFQIEEVPDRDGFAQDLEKVNCVVFAACQVNEVSIVYAQEWKNGFFTYYIVQGLWGAADHNTDGKISIRELYDYSYPKVVGLAEIYHQYPEYQEYNFPHPLLWPEDDIADNIYIIKLKTPAPKKISVPAEYSAIQEAIEAAMPGDTIEVAPGTYNENVILNKPLTINAPYRDSIIHAANNSSPCVFITVDNTSISGLTCRNGSDGIRLFMSNNTVISNNIANYNHYQGIRLGASNENIIANNTAMYNEWYGIYLKESNDNRITDNDASNSVDYNGIVLNSSNNNEIRNNIANYNHYQGIGLWTSSGNIIASNTAKYNEVYGIYLEESNYNMITDNDASNSVDYHGIGLNSSNNNEIRNNIANYNHYQGIGLWTSSGNIIASNTAKYNEGNGIYLEESNYNMITDNDASNSINYHGIGLNSSNNNEIRNNIANYNHYQGIGLWTSSGNIIASNTAKYNEGNGICLDESNYNMITDNDASNSINYHGIGLNSSNNNEIQNNIANYNHYQGIGLWTSNENIIANNNAKYNEGNGICLDESNDNMITDNDASNSINYHGIVLNSSNNNEIQNNIANYNHYQGIGLWTSNENIIANNTAKYNGDRGIYLEESNNNEIYLNNFMDNDYNVYSIGSTNVWNSQSKITYTYKGSTYTNYLLTFTLLHFPFLSSCHA